MNVIVTVCVHCVDCVTDDNELVAVTPGLNSVT